MVECFPEPETRHRTVWAQGPQLDEATKSAKLPNPASARTSPITFCSWDSSCRRPYSGFTPVHKHIFCLHAH